MRRKAGLILFGILFSFLLLESGLRLGGWFYLSLQAWRNQRAARAGGAYRILCLGESTTAATTVQDISYPRQLERMLNERDPGRRFAVINEGVSGIDTSNLLAGLKDKLDRYRPNMVITMMGINDSEGYVFFAPPGEAWSPSRLFMRFRAYKLLKLLRANLLEWTQARWPRKGSNRAGDVKRIVASVERLMNEERYPEAERTAAEAIGQDPGNDSLYVSLGGIYFRHRMYGKAEEVLRELIRRRPGNAEGYAGLGQVYWWDGKYEMAEEILKEAIARRPGDDRLYLLLSRSYESRDRYREAKETVEKVIRRNPGDKEAYLELIILCERQGKYGEAEKVTRKVIAMDPRNERFYMELGRICGKEGRYGALQDALANALPQRSAMVQAHTASQRLLALGALENGPQASLESGPAQAEPAGRDSNTDFCYSERTKRNYEKLRWTLKERGIAYVCMQYPVRSIRPLKEIFGDGEDIIFVDNERAFKEAIRREGHQSLFADMFAFDFGHCNARGNALLAANAAAAIEKALSRAE